LAQAIRSQAESPERTSVFHPALLTTA